MSLFVTKVTIKIKTVKQYDEQVESRQTKKRDGKIRKYIKSPASKGRGQTRKQKGRLDRANKRQRSENRQT